MILFISVSKLLEGWTSAFTSRLMCQFSEPITQDYPLN